MSRVLALAAGLVVTLFASASSAIDPPPGTADLGPGIQPLATQFDAERGQHRLLVLLSPA